MTTHDDHPEVLRAAARPDASEPGQGTRPESDGPDRPHPPAMPDPKQPDSPETTPDVHGDPEPPS
jgi:hypothetical protein